MSTQGFSTLNFIIGVVSILGFFILTYYAVLHAIGGDPLAVGFIVLAVDQIYDAVRFLKNEEPRRETIVLTTLIDVVTVAIAYSLITYLIPFAYVSSTVYAYLIGLLIIYVVITLVEIAHDIESIIHSKRSITSTVDY